MSGIDEASERGWRWAALGTTSNALILTLLGPLLLAVMIALYGVTIEMGLARLLAASARVVA